MTMNSGQSLFLKGLSGAVFGSALTASEVWRPSVIMSQMALENFDMLQSFLVGTATSALLVYFFERRGAFDVKPRQGVHLGLFAGFDGNVLGGLAVGAGMTLSGACPGTAIVQLAHGVPSATFVIAGAVLGGILYDAAIKRRVQQRQASAASSKTDVTVMETARLSHGSVLVGFEILGSFVVTAAALSSPSRAAFHPIVGGFFIGLAQLIVLSLTCRLVGVSTVYEGLGRAILSFFSSATCKERPKLTTVQQSSIVFATGLYLSSWVSAQLNLQPWTTEHEAIPTSRAIIGGVLLSQGAHVAGGCTSGHGISGMSMFSISSIITVASMFIGGMGLSALLR